MLSLRKSFYFSSILLALFERMDISHSASEGHLHMLLDSGSFDFIDCQSGSVERA
jgi:hypothetical protein